MGQLPEECFRSFEHVGIAQQNGENEVEECKGASQAGLTRPPFAVATMLRVHLSSNSGVGYLDLDLPSFHGRFKGSWPLGYFQSNRLDGRSQLMTRFVQALSCPQGLLVFVFLHLFLLYIQPFKVNR